MVIDEINSYKDSPGELIFDDFEELIYPDYPIGRNILGSEKAVKASGGTILSISSNGITGREEW